MAISSRMYKIIGSNKRPIPFGKSPFWYDFAILVNIKNMNTATKKMNTTFLVIEKSTGFRFDG